MSYHKPLTSPVLFTKSMPDPRDSKHADSPEALQYAITALTCMRNKYLSTNTHPLIESEALFDNIVTIVASNLCTSRPEGLSSIIQALYNNTLSGSNTDYQKKQQQLYLIIEKASLTSVLWTARQRIPFIKGEEEFLKSRVSFNISYADWLANDDSIKQVDGKIGSTLFKLIVADKAKTILETPDNLSDCSKITLLNRLLARIPNEYGELAQRTSMSVEDWRTRASEGSPLAQFLHRAAEATPFDANSSPF